MVIIEEEIFGVHISWYGHRDIDSFKNYYENDEIFNKFICNNKYIDVRTVCSFYPVYVGLGRLLGITLTSDISRWNIKIRVNKIKNIDKYGCHVYPNMKWAISNSILLDINKYFGLDDVTINICESEYPGIINLGKWTLILACRNFSSFEEEEEPVTIMNGIISLDDVW